MVVGGGVNGRGIVCEVDRDNDDRISMTEDGIKFAVPASDVPQSTCETGTEPGGSEAKMYGLT
jgi:hypothetical protein